MTAKLKSIMLVDDNPHDNFFHKRIINKAGCAENIIEMTTAVEALEYLKNISSPNEEAPSLILLDINMPGMNGWEFLEEYEKLDNYQKSKAIVVMLTTSINPDDEERAHGFQAISNFKTKPLTDEMLTEILQSYFPENF